MKNIFFGLALFVGLLGVWVYYERSEARHKYLKEETMLRHLKKEPLLSKAPAPWMLEQIDEDFQGIGEISVERVDRTYQRIKSPYPWVARYRIVDGELYRYFEEGKPVPFEDNSTEKAIKTLLQKTDFGDMDFIVSFLDPYPFDSPDFAYTDVDAPILVSAKLKGAPKGILIPDYRSIGHWWMSDIKSVKKAFIPWEEKKEFAVWRGGLTKLLRKKLCEISKEHRDCLDARLSSAPMCAETHKWFESEGMMGDRMSWEELLKCKYHPYVDGQMCAAPALQWRLLSLSLIFKPDSEEIQWFYRALQPNVHYVPVKSDLSDLIEKIHWAKSHDAESKKIAENAFAFAKENILYGDVLNYFALVLQRYGSCQHLDRKGLKKELEADCRWVKIQYRDDIRRKAKEKNMVGYCIESAPPG